jgi:hypothetical protein
MRKEHALERGGLAKLGEVAGGGGGNVHANRPEEDHDANVEEVRDAYRKAKEYTYDSGPAVLNISNSSIMSPPSRLMLYSSSRVITSMKLPDASAA